MLICIRCVTCNKVLADKWDWYQQEVLKLQKKTDDASAKKASKPTKTKKGGAANDDLEKEGLKNFDDLRTGPIMDKLGLTRICCRRHMLTTVDMMEMI